VRNNSKITENRQLTWGCSKCINCLSTN